MQYRQLGNSGLRISIIGLGTNVFGQHETFTHYCDERETAAIIHRAADLGINHIDTADMYSRGVSETYIGKAVAGQRDRFVIASKVGLPVGDGPNDAGLSRGHIMSSIEGTLRRLDTDYVDLYYAHRPDPATPIEETLRAFDDLVRQGKVRYVGMLELRGLGNRHGERRCRAARLCALPGQPVGVQPLRTVAGSRDPSLLPAPRAEHRRVLPPGPRRFDGQISPGRADPARHPGLEESESRPGPLHDRRAVGDGRAARCLDPGSRPPNERTGDRLAAGQALRLYGSGRGHQHRTVGSQRCGHRLDALAGTSAGSGSHGGRGIVAAELRTGGSGGLQPPIPACGGKRMSPLP